MKIKKLTTCTVVILSFNTKDITQECIKRAIVARLEYERVRKELVEIIVVDNASEDGTIELIKQKYPEITLLALIKNVGVARGYNAGMKESRTPYILIINSDTYIQKNTLVQSVAYLENNSDCDVVIPYLIDGKGKFRQYGGHLPTSLRTIRWLLGFESIPFLKHHIKRIYKYNKEFYQQDGHMEWAPTCFFMLRKEVLDATKGNDEKMFLYMEDLEWCERINRAGFLLKYTPSIRVTHLGGESTEKKMQTQKLLERQVEGMLYYQKKHYPKTYNLVTSFLVVGFSMRILFYTLTGKIKQALAYKDVISSPIR